MSFSQLVSELGPPPEKVKSKKKKKKKKAFRFWAPPLANSWTRACYCIKNGVTTKYHIKKQLQLVLMHLLLLQSKHEIGKYQGN